MNEKDRRVTESFIKYGTVIKKNCVDYLKDEHEAEDILQETFFKFGNSYEKIPEEKTKAWLLTVSSHLCVDLLKKSGRKPVVIGLPVPDAKDVIAPVDLSELFATKENGKEHLLVLEQLRKKHPNWYQVMLLSIVEELDNTTIGRLMDQKPELISKWKGRAREWLRKRYEEEYRNR